MTVTLGLDVGTTTVSVVALEVASGDVLATRTREHNAGRSLHPGWAELDIGQVGALALSLIAEMTEGLRGRGASVDAIGVAGQQHGLALLGPEGRSLAPAITWQDRRIEQTAPGGGASYLLRFVELAGGPAAFQGTGAEPAAGYLGPTLYWLQRQGQLPPVARACFIPDAIVALLTGELPATDPTGAGSSALYDVVEGRWAWALIDRLDLPRALFPDVQPTGSLAGALAPAAATATGLPAGTPVAVALGDNQASFIGSVAEPGRAVLVNIGTGGQISAMVRRYERLPGFDTRAFPPSRDDERRYLLVGAGYPGGSAYAALRDFFRRVGQELFSVSPGHSLYEAMNRLAASAPPGCDGVRCEPLFDGTRAEPGRRAAFTGLSAETFTPGHLSRALLEGLARGYGELYAAMRPLTGERERLVGAGNGLRRNPLLARLMANALGLPLCLTEQEEAAALGAAITAAVAIGALGHADDGSRRLRYAVTVEPG